MELQEQTNLGYLLSVQLQCCRGPKCQAKDLYNSTPCTTDWDFGDTEEEYLVETRGSQAKAGRGESQTTALYLFLPKITQLSLLVSLTLAHQKGIKKHSYYMAGTRVSRCVKWKFLVSLKTPLCLVMFC